MRRLRGGTKEDQAGRTRLIDDNIIYNNEISSHSGRLCGDCKIFYIVIDVLTIRSLILHRKRTKVILQCVNCGRIKKCSYKHAKLQHNMSTYVFDGGELDDI
jgi:hypothetical protein